MTIEIKTKNQKKIAATKSFLTAIDLKYKEKIEKPYNPEFVERILKSREQHKQGLGRIVKIEDLWK